MLHKVHVVITVSMLMFSSGIASADPSISSGEGASGRLTQAAPLSSTDQGGGKRRSGNSATGMIVALTVVKPGGFVNRLLIIGLLVMFTLPL